MLDLLKASLEEAPVVKMGNYDYFVHPLTDGVPEIKPELIQEIVGEIKNNLIKDYDKFVTIEAMGLPIGITLAMNMNKPLVVIRKRSYGFDDEVAVQQVTGYSKGQLFINGLEPDDKIVIVDDVVSTGGTLIAVLKALINMGIDIVDVIVVIEKRDSKMYVEEQTGIEIKTLVTVDIINERVILFDG